MAENKSYLSYEGLVTLVNQIRAKFALDASLKLTDGSLKTHIDDAVKHITADERSKWNNAVDTANNAVSKTDYNKKVQEIDSSIGALKSDKADKATTLAGYGIGDAYTKTQVDDKISALGSVFSFKGTLADVSALPLTGNKKGDVYHLNAKSAEYVWTLDASAGTKEGWEELGSTVDLSSYATQAYVDAKFTNKDASFAGTAAKATMAEDSKKLGGIAAANYAQLTDITLKGVKVNGTALAIDASKNVDVTVAEGTANGTIAVNGVDVSVHGLKSAAYEDISAFATAVQGKKADTAIQPGDLTSALEPYAKTADVAANYATKAEVSTLDGAAEKTANKVDDISAVTDTDASVKYPSVKAVKKAIKEGIDAGDTRVKQTAITNGVHPILMAGATASEQSAEAKYAAGVTIDAANGTLTATTFKGALDGNAKTATMATEATKASQDASGNIITATYATKDEVKDVMVGPIDTSDIVGLFAGI